MKAHVDLHTFVKAFDDYGRGDDFSRGGREALFRHYEEMEADLNTDLDFDCIAICCDWSEYHNAYAWADDYYSGDAWMQALGIEGEDWKGSEDYSKEILEHLYESTQVIEFDDGILVQAF